MLLFMSFCNSIDFKITSSCAHNANACSFSIIIEIFPQMFSRDVLHYFILNDECMIGSDKNAFCMFVFTKLTFH